MVEIAQDSLGIIETLNASLSHWKQYGQPMDFP